MEIEIPFGKRAIRIDTAEEREAAEGTAEEEWTQLEREVITHYSPELARRQTIAFLRHAALNARHGKAFAIYKIPTEFDKAA